MKEVYIAPGTRPRPLMNIMMSSMVVGKRLRSFDGQ
jgi:hypothetical protein